MSDRFLRGRSHLAHEEAVRTLEVTVHRVANLVLKASALADRMEARPSRDLDEARDRKARVTVLRDAASAGQQAIQRSTARLSGEHEDDVASDKG